VEILIPGHRNDSSEQRRRLTRKNLDHYPAWRCQPLNGREFYLCGKCFSKRGAGPYTNQSEVWMAGTDKIGAFHYDIVPIDARCIDCAKPAWPAD
jgi:hypothetical protein